MAPAYIKRGIILLITVLVIGVAAIYAFSSMTEGTPFDIYNIVVALIGGMVAFLSYRLWRRRQGVGFVNGTMIILGLTQATIHFTRIFIG